MNPNLITDQSAQLTAHTIVTYFMENKVFKAEMRAALWHEYIKAVDPFEKEFVETLISLFSRQEKEVLANMRKMPKIWRVSGKHGDYILSDELMQDYAISNSIDVKALKADESIIDTWLFGRSAWQRIFKEETEPIIQGVFVVNGERELAKLPVVGISFNVSNPRAIDFIEETTRNYSSEVLNTVSNDLRATLTEGFKAGESMQKLSKRVRGVYDGYTVGTLLEGEALPPWKSLRIARTETTAASNFGTIEAYKQSNVVEKKEWLATLDARVRDSHARLDGEQVNLIDRFSNGLEYPGDPSGQIEEIVNCRCTMVSVLKKEKEWLTY